MSQPGYPTYALSKMGDFSGGDCYIHLTATVLSIITPHGKQAAVWPYSYIRSFDCHDDIFTFTSGRKGPFGVEKYDFRFLPAVFEGFKAALSAATGATFASKPGSVLPSSTLGAQSNQCYVTHPPKQATPVSNANGDVQSGQQGSTDFALSRLSSVSSTCSSSSCSSTSSLSLTEDSHPSTLRKQISVPTFKRVVHQYDEVDLPAAGSSLPNSPSTSPCTYAASNASAGDVCAVRGARRTTSQPPSYEDVALPSTPGHVKTLPPPTAHASPLAHASTTVDHKLQTVYENVNPYQHYDFVTLRHSSSIPLKPGCGGSLDNGGMQEGRTQLSFISSSGEEVLYDVPRPLHGGQGPLGQSTYEDVRSYGSLTGDRGGNDRSNARGVNNGSQPNVLRMLSSPPTAPSPTTTTTSAAAPLRHQYVNLVGLSTQLGQSAPTVGDGIHIGDNAPPFVSTGPTALCTRNLVMARENLDALSDRDYVLMSPSGLHAWPTKVDSMPNSNGERAHNGKNGWSVVVEPGEEEWGEYVVMKRPVCGSSLREPVLMQEHDGTRNDATKMDTYLVPAAERARPL